MRLKIRGNIATLLLKALSLIAAMVSGYVDKFGLSTANKEIYTHTAEVKREKVCCHTNSMEAVKWTSRKNLGHMVRANRKLSETEGGQIQGFALFRGG